ncbi:MAG TPA: DMT family transporter, partial [Herpetosiphonaceae bacterium]
ELMAIGASLLYAGYLVTTGQVRARIGTLPFMMLSVSIGAAVLLVTCLATGQPLAGFPAKSWAALLGLGLVSQLGGWLVINYALGHLPAHVVSVTLLGQAVVTALLAIPVLHELPTPLQLGGGALVLAGIALVTARQAPSAQASPPPGGAGA